MPSQAVSTVAFRLCRSTSRLPPPPAVHLTSRHRLQCTLALEHGTRFSSHDVAALKHSITACSNAFGRALFADRMVPNRGRGRGRGRGRVRVRVTVRVKVRVRVRIRVRVSMVSIKVVDCAGVVDIANNL